MNIELLNKIDLSSAIIGAGVCVGKSVKQASIKGLISAVEQGHLSVLEHIWLDFYIEDVSIALSRQLLRHRLMSPHERSLRYCVFNSEGEWFVQPDTIKDEAEQEFNSAMLECHRVYDRLISLGVPAEDARYVLPLATKTKLAISMNLRTFIEICPKRICETAQDEIRALITEARNLMVDAVLEQDTALATLLFKLSLPDCKNCKEKRGCHAK